MNRKLYLLLAIFSSIISIQSANAQTTSFNNKVEVKNNGATIEYPIITGKIDKKQVNNVVRFLEQEKGHDKTLIIASDAADIYATMQLAHYIERNPVNIYIKGVCVDECVSLLLPLAKKVTIEENSMLSIRYSATSSYKWLVTRGVKIGKGINQIAELEYGYLKSKNINTKMLDCAFINSKPKIEYISKDGNKFRVTFENAGWHLNKQELAELGIKNIEYVGMTKSVARVQNKISKIKFADIDLNNCK